jgi:hypothetical protein
MVGHMIGFLRLLLDKSLSASAKFISTFGAKSITGPVKDISGSIKDVTGIRKDIVETRLAEYELAEKESVIERPTLEQIERFDVKYQLAGYEAREALNKKISAIARKSLTLFLILGLLGSISLARDKDVLAAGCMVAFVWVMSFIYHLLHLTQQSHRGDVECSN